MKFKIVFFVFLCMFFGKSIDVNGQISKDSLLNIFHNEEIDINVRWQAISVLLNNEIPISGEELQKIIQAYENVDEDDLSVEERLKFRVLNGAIYSNAGEKRVSEKYYESAYEIYKQNRNQNYDFAFLGNFANVKNELGKNTEAVSLMMEHISITEKNEKWWNLTNAYYNLGNFMFKLNKHKEGKDAHVKALEIAEKHNLNDVKILLLESLGLDALNINDLEDAEAKFLEAIAFCKEHGDIFTLMQIKNNLGIVFEEMGRLEEASAIYNEVENVYIKNDHILGLANVNLDKGYLEMKKNNFTKAIEYCEFAKENYFKLGDIHSIKEAYYCLYDAAKKSNNYKSALSYYESYQKYNDSLITMGNIQQITEMRKDFEFEKEKEKTEMVHLQEISQEKLFQKLLGLGLILLLGMLFFAYRAYRIKTKINVVISQQNSQLEKFNAANENLIYLLSHDIKEPMLGVQLLLGRMKSDDNNLQNAAKSIGNQVASINSIVNNLLQLKKASSVEQSETLNKEEVQDTVESVLNSLRYKIENKNLKIENQLGEDSTITLPISKQKFYLALLNLLTNAIKYSPEGEVIQIYAKADGIYVRDFGSGIDNELLSKLGTEYTNDAKSDKSSGLGLVLVSNVLAGTGVALICNNASGGGAEVGLKLL